MKSTWCGKKPNFPWSGSQSQWDQERSDQIRVGECIFHGYEQANNYLKGSLFETSQMKKDKQKWRDSLKSKVDTKVKLALEYIDPSNVGLTDFM